MRLIKDTVRNSARIVKDTFWNTKPAKAQSGAIIAAALVLMFIPNFSSAYTPLFLSWLIPYCVYAVAWAFFSGKTGYISLASAAFYGIGIYMQAILGREFPLVVVMLFAAGMAFAVGAIIGMVTLRLRGIFFTIFTFGLSLFLNKFLHWYEGMYTRTKGRMVKPYDDLTIFYAVLIVLIVTLVAVLLFNKSKFGLSLRCIGQNEDSARHLGVKTIKTKVLAFAISAAPVAAVGVVMSSKIGYIDPDIAFAMNISFFPVLMAIFGGMNSTYGPIVGAIVFFVLDDYLRQTTSSYMVIFGIILVVVILIMPKGLFGAIESAIAKRRGPGSCEEAEGDE